MSILRKETTLHIELIARGVLIQSSRVLLCQTKKRGYFYLPGGHVEFGEPAAAALEREIMEECGVAVRAGELALITEERFTSRREHHEINLVFHVKHSIDGTPASREEEIRFEWCDLGAVGERDVRPESVKGWLLRGAAAEGRAGWASCFT